MYRKVSVLAALSLLLSAFPSLGQPAAPPAPPPAPAPAPLPEAPEVPPDAPPDGPVVEPGEEPPPPEPEVGEATAADATKPKAPVTELPPVPMAPPALFPSQLEDYDDERPNVGLYGGRLYIRSDDDNFRLYPGGRARLDFAYAPGAPDLPAGQGERFTNPAFYVRMVRLELHGEILQRLAFTMSAELGSATPGATVYAGADTPRWVRSNAHDGLVTPTNTFVSYRVRDWLSFSAGLYDAPFSLAGRTPETGTTFLERPLAIRSFAKPFQADLGVEVWGELLGKRTLAYEIGVFGGDGADRPFVDSRPDVMGRIFARPLTGVGDGVFFEMAQIGVSARHGERDQEHVDYDYPTIATQQGFVLWQPGYIDDFDRITHVIPSGAQNAIGGELRVPFGLPTGSVFDIHGEAYYVANNTREAVDGFQLTNTERFGRVKGVGWYAMVSFWGCCTDQLVSPEPGITRPVTVDLSKEDAIKRGINVAAIAGGIHANYSGATREESLPDPNTPSADIDVYQFGGIVQYWYSWNFRAAIEYMLYFAPDSGLPPENQVVVPDNLVGGGKHLHHELGMRLAVSF